MDAESQAPISPHRGARRDQVSSPFMVSSVSGGRLNAVEMSNYCHTRHPNRAEFAGAPEVNLERKHVWSIRTQ